MALKLIWLIIGLIIGLPGEVFTGQLLMGFFFTLFLLLKWLLMVLLPLLCSTNGENTGVVDRENFWVTFLDNAGWELRARCCKGDCDCMNGDFGRVNGDLVNGELISVFIFNGEFISVFVLNIEFISVFISPLFILNNEESICIIGEGDLANWRGDFARKENGEENADWCIIFGDGCTFIIFGDCCTCTIFGDGCTRL